MHSAYRMHQHLQNRIKAIHQRHKTAVLTDSQKRVYAWQLDELNRLVDLSIEIIGEMQALQNSVEDLRRNADLAKKIQLLQSTRVNAAEYAKWRAQYLANNGKPITMDFNTHQVI